MVVVVLVVRLVRVTCEEPQQLWSLSVFLEERELTNDAPVGRLYIGCRRNMAAVTEQRLISVYNYKILQTCKVFC